VSDHVDGLTAMVMVHHAVDDDMVTIRRKMGAEWRRYHYCLRHLLHVVHRAGQRKDGDVKFYTRDEWEMVIAKDDLQDQFRRDTLRLVAIEKPTDDTWHKCVHCRLEARKRG
jgi:hypothetical protein